MPALTPAPKPRQFPPCYTPADIANFPKARYRLTEAHQGRTTINGVEYDVWLPGDKDNEWQKKPGPNGEPDEREYGTVVGAGTRYPWPWPPTPAMIGLDEMSQALIDKEVERGAGLNPVDHLPLVVNEAVIGDSDA